MLPSHSTSSRHLLTNSNCRWTTDPITITAPTVTGEVGESCSTASSAHGGRILRSHNSKKVHSSSSASEDSSPPAHGDSTSSSCASASFTSTSSHSSTRGGASRRSNRGKRKRSPTSSSSHAKTNKQSRQKMEADTTDQQQPTHQPQSHQKQCQPPPEEALLEPSSSVVVSASSDDRSVSWQCVLPFISTFTDLVRLRQCSRPSRALFNTPINCEIILRHHFRITPEQQAIITTSQQSKVDIVSRFLPCLAEVETHLLRHHSIPPLHLSLLVQALLTSSFVSRDHSRLDRVGDTRHPPAGSRNSHLYRFDQPRGSTERGYSGWVLRELFPSLFPSRPLPSSNALHSVDYSSSQSLTLWLGNPWKLRKWVQFWCAEVLGRRHWHPSDFYFSLRNGLPDEYTESWRDGMAVKVLHELDGRVLWIGDGMMTLDGFRQSDRRNRDYYRGPAAVGYFFGRVQAEEEKTLLRMPHAFSSTTIGECQRRMLDPQIDWSTLPVICWELDLTREELTEVDPLLTLYPSLRHFLDSRTSLLPFPLPPLPVCRLYQPVYVLRLNVFEEWLREEYASIQRKLSRREEYRNRAKGRR